MRPLWEAAKKTVDGGIKDLKMIIEERRKNTDDEDTVVLKLEVLERDLELISMVRWRRKNKGRRIRRWFESNPWLRPGLLKKVY